MTRRILYTAGMRWALYTLTDGVGLIPLGGILSFSGLGLSQRLKRKSLRRVDRSIFALGGLYRVVLAAYALFETVVNCRPLGGVISLLDHPACAMCAPDSWETAEKSITPTPAGLGALPGWGFVSASQSGNAFYRISVT